MTQTKGRRPSRKNEVLLAFTKRVSAQGYDATSLSEVAEDVGLSKGTIMHHFGSKDRMLEQMSLGYMERRLHELRIVKDIYGKPVDQLAALVTVLITAFRDDHAATRAFSREFMRFAEDEVMLEVRRLRRQFTDELYDIISRGVKQGEIASELPHVTALQIIGMCNWSWTWIDPDGPISVEEIAASYISGILGGLSTSAPREYRAELPEAIIAARESTSSVDHKGPV